MKLTNKLLKQIIKEELQTSLNEMYEDQGLTYSEIENYMRNNDYVLVNEAPPVEPPDKFYNVQNGVIGIMLGGKIYEYYPAANVQNGNVKWKPEEHENAIKFITTWLEEKGFTKNENMVLNMSQRDPSFLHGLAYKNM